MLQSQRNRISFSANLPDDVRGAITNSICVVKYSVDPLSDIRESIREMVINVGVKDWKEMEELVYCYIVLNSEEMATNDTAKDWGLKCLRYEIRDISPPPGVRTAMEMQAEAERKKRAQVLELEGERQTNINIADGRKSSVILASEAAKMDQVNRAQGEAEAILYRAQATARMQAASQAELKQSDSSAVNNNDHFITAEDYKKDD
ncbi:hypothetical protein RND71_006415 [Anisodus tanguticus]|uniref:OVATE domain-containing protein n=1 Tax=Anisodus tanguticus TaxID=243964 RepID=A0AAE1SU72_9SOLA|nr:hypothetical protein RND71_006415 [Anisodus tanguticus]